MNARLKPAVLLPRQVLVVDTFISPGICDRILDDLNCCYWRSSAVVQRNDYGLQTEVRQDFRASVTADQKWFGPKLLQIVERIEKQLSFLLGCVPSCLEPWQATRYERGGRFDYHVDGGHWKKTAGGDRKRTYLIYLDHPERGGETHFRALNMRVAPKPGRLVAWENLLPSGLCDHAMIHGGLEIRKGKKTTLVTWERERSVRKAGK